MSAAPGQPHWTTWVECPHCRTAHRVCWPHGAFPSGSGHLAFSCPATSRRVVFATTVPWGETDPGAPEAQGTVAEPFYE